MRAFWLLVICMVGAGGYFVVGLQAPPDSVTFAPEEALLAREKAAQSREIAPSPLEYVTSLRGQEDSETYWVKLATSYASWVGNREALEARQEILKIFGSAPDPTRALILVVRSVSSDPTPPEQDPMWSSAAEQLLPLWKDSQLLRAGRDLMLAARNGKAQRLLASSLLQFGLRADSDELPDSLRTTLAADFIDLYFLTSDEKLKSEIHDHIGALAGEEVAAALGSPDWLPEISEAENTARAVAEIVEDACQPGISLDTFAAAVAALQELHPEALQQLSSRASIVQESVAAREILEKALRTP
ncbi:MAG: hypothetical protein V3T77_06395 [Planctomycetota bacterium]